MTNTFIEKFESHVDDFRHTPAVSYVFKNEVQDDSGWLRLAQKSLCIDQNRLSTICFSRDYFMN